MENTKRNKKKDSEKPSSKVDNSSPEDKKLQIDYWMKRLDHTLQHTQTSTKQIYLVDGAVIALIYFMFKNFGCKYDDIILLASFPILLLSALNFLHAGIIYSQQKWYSAICERLLALVNQEQVARESKTSTHCLYKWMHYVIGGFLALVGMFMCIYGFVNSHA